MDHKCKFLSVEILLGLADSKPENNISIDSFEEWLKCINNSLGVIEKSTNINIYYIRSILSNIKSNKKYTINQKIYSICKELLNFANFIINDY